jgi:hypothetical protein
MHRAVPVTASARSSLWVEFAREEVSCIIACPFDFTLAKVAWMPGQPGIKLS